MQDLSAPDAEEHAQPALQAAELALAEADAAVELAIVDIADPSAVEEAAADPTIVAAIVAPGADGSAFAEAGVPTVSVSTAGPTPVGGPWRRLVAPIDAVADAVAAGLVGARACVLSEAPAPDALADLLSDRLEGPSAAVAPGDATPLVRANGCEAVAWAGSPDPGAELARALPAGIALLGGDRLLDPDFLARAGPEAEGTRAACACTDVSTSTDPAVIRFIQDYQAEFGSPPGPYAAEAWDAARALLAALTAGADRAVVAAGLEGLDALTGLAATYRFAPTGELSDPAQGVELSTLRSGRWVRSPPRT